MGWNSKPVTCEKNTEQPVTNVAWGKPVNGVYRSKGGRFEIVADGKGKRRHYELHDKVRGTKEDYLWSLADAKAAAQETVENEARTPNVGWFLSADLRTEHTYDANKYNVVFCFTRFTMERGKPALSRDGWTLESWFQSEGYAEQWSWHHKGLKVDSKVEAERIAKAVLGHKFLGWID
jgi:hypothetical protein